MEYLYTFFTLFGCSAVWLLPTALTAAAIVDMVRVRAEWYWCFIIFGVPLFGPLAYFAINYLPIFGGSQAVSTLSPIAYRRTQARRRLKELQIQLQHWRGPAVLAEAGAQLLSLGKLKDAEAVLREAKDADAEVKDVNFNLAQVLQVRGKRWKEALPLLDELVALEPDARFGAARLALARCLDESGQAERAEDELRAVLKKRSPPEGKVRLARRLLARGEGREASELLAEVRADAAAMPKYLVKEHRPWIRMAQKLKADSTKLPTPKLEGVPPKRGPAFVAAMAIGGLLLLAGLIVAGRLYVLPLAEMMGGTEDLGRWYEIQQDNQERLDGLSRALPSRLGEDELRADVVGQLLPAFLAVRRQLAPACEPAVAAVEERRQALGEMQENDRWGTALSLSRRLNQWQEAQAVFGSAFVTALESHELTPSDAERLFALCDGTFLDRAGARVLTIPSHFRADYAIAAATLAEPLPPRSQPEWRRDVMYRQEKQTAKMQDLLQLTTTAIPPETGEVLAGHRRELERSLPSSCLTVIARVLEPELAWHTEPPDSVPAPGPPEPGPTGPASPNTEPTDSVPIDTAPTDTAQPNWDSDT